MAGISQIEELEARKQALVTESEICREALKAEFHNLALYGSNLRKRMDQVRSFGPWLLLGLPMAAPLVSLFSRLRKRGDKEQKNAAPQSRANGGVATALLAFRLYRKYSPLLRSLVAHLASRSRSRAEDRSPAANI